MPANSHHIELLPWQRVSEVLLAGGSPTWGEYARLWMLLAGRVYTADTRPLDRSFNSTFKTALWSALNALDDSDLFALTLEGIIDKPDRLELLRLRHSERPPWIR